ncbi:MAG: porin family protein [Devosia sp.]|jgi:opacity protein-like surface antigen|nr:porin family protein [Devosia sp.]
MTLYKLLGGAAAVALIAGTPALAADLIVDVPVDEPVTVADTGWYFSVFAGGLWDGFVTAEDDSDPDADDVEVSTDAGWLLGAAVGTHVFDSLRAEVELYGASRNVNGASEGALSIDLDGTVTTVGLLGNLWVDFDTGSGFTPYIGGGLGVGYVHAESPGAGPVAPLDADGVGLAYQLGAGVQVDVADNIALDLGYRWKGVSAEISGDGTEDVVAHVGSHVVQVGLTFGF